MIGKEIKGSWITRIFGVFIGLMLLLPGSTAAQDPVSEDVTYYLQVMNSGNLIEIPGYSRDNGVQVVLNSRHGGASQMFRFKKTSNPGYYTIMNAYSKKVLDIPGASTQDGVGVIQFEERGGNNQQFKLVHAAGAGDDKYYYIINLNSGKALQADPGNSNGLALRQQSNQGIQNQMFKLIPNLPPPAPKPQKVVLNTPVTGQVMDHGTGVVWNFDWADVPGAYRYQILIEHSNKSDRLLNTYVDGASEYSYTFKRDIAENLTREPWGWWVRAQVGSEWGAWSDPHTIFLKQKQNVSPAPPPPPTPTPVPQPALVPTPQLISPQSNTSLLNGADGGLNWTFQWRGVPGANRYEIKVGYQETGVHFDEFVDGNRTSYTYKYDGFIKEDFLRDWYWEVRAEVNGRWSEWSPRNRFNVHSQNYKPEPINNFGTGYFRIMGGFINAYLGKEETVYSTSREVMYGPTVLAVQHEDDQFLEFVLEGQSATEEKYLIKAYMRDYNNRREELGYLDYSLEFRGGPDQTWIIRQHPRGYFQIMTQDGRMALEIKDAERAGDKLHMKLEPTSGAQRQSFRINRN